MSSASPSRRRVLVPAIKLLVTAAVVWFVWDTLRKGMADLDRSDWRADYWWLGGASLLYLFGLLPPAVFWQRVLGAFGQRPPLGATLRAYYIGHLGKYVPGKALVVVIRSNLLAKHGVGFLTGVVSVIVETLTMMAVGAALAAAVGVMIFHDQPRLWMCSLLLVLVFGLPTLPLFVNGLLKRRLGVLLRLDSERASGAGKATPPDDPPDQPSDAESDDSFDAPCVSWRLTVTGWVLNVAGWCILGLSLWAVLRSLVPADMAPLPVLPLYTAAVALALIAGFISGLPGGIGVRDGVLVAVLAQMVPEETALVAAVLLRIVWLVSEVAISGILYIGRVSSPRDPKSPAATDVSTAGS